MRKIINYNANSVMRLQDIYTCNVVIYRELQD